MRSLATSHKYIFDLGFNSPYASALHPHRPAGRLTLTTAGCSRRTWYMLAKRRQLPPLPELPTLACPIPGYLRTDVQASIVKFEGDGKRFIFHELDGCPKPLRDHLQKNSSTVSKQLQQDLRRFVGELKDSDVTLFKRRTRGVNSSFQPDIDKPGRLSWQDNVKLQDVQQDGPGSRAYSPTQKVTAVVPTRDLVKYSVVGLYLGYVLDSDQYDSEVSAEQRQSLRYQYHFNVDDEISSSSSQGTHRRKHNKQGKVSHFVVDASQCLEGNPMAHVLDCRAFSEGWQVDKQRSSKPNAMLLPFSDNSTGRVYVAVLTLQDISVESREDICVDYGDAYWSDKADHDSYLQLARKQVQREEVEGLKQELRKLGEQLCDCKRAEVALKQGLMQLLVASSTAMLALSQQPGSQADVAGLAAANAAATLVLHDNQQAVAAAVAAEVSSQVGAGVDQAKDALAAEHAATVRRLEWEWNKVAAGHAVLEQQLQHQHQQHAAKVQELRAHINRLGAAAAARWVQEQRDKQAAASGNQKQQLQSRAAVGSKLQQQVATSAPQAAASSLPIYTRREAATAACSPAAMRKRTHSEAQQLEQQHEQQQQQKHRLQQKQQQQEEEEQQQETIRIYVTHCKGTQMACSCPPETDLRSIFKCVAKFMGTERTELTFSFDGKRLDGSKTLSEYGIGNRDVIDCFNKQTGC